MSAILSHLHTDCAHRVCRNTAPATPRLRHSRSVVTCSKYRLCAGGGRQHWQATPGQQTHRVAARHAVIAAAVDTLTYGAEWTTPKDSYVVLGLAHCFERGEDGGKLQDVFVIEPVSANSLECMVAGADTCFKAVAGVTLGDAMARDRSKLPEEFAEAAFCDDYDFRCDATARTWLRPHAQDNLLDIVPLGASRSNFNYSVDQKRVLNMENVVNDADNIKQDMSIDVYGRKEEDDAPQEEAASSSNGAPQQQTSEKEDDDDDGLDDLFAE